MMGLPIFHGSSSGNSLHSCYFVSKPIFHVEDLLAKIVLPLFLQCLFGQFSVRGKASL